MSTSNKQAIIFTLLEQLQAFVIVPFFKIFHVLLKINRGAYMKRLSEKYFR